MSHFISQVSSLYPHKILSTALCAKGPVGTCPRTKLKKECFNYNKPDFAAGKTTARPHFGQKIVPIFLFFCLGRDPLGTFEKPQRGRKTFPWTSPLRVLKEVRPDFGPKVGTECGSFFRETFLREIKYWYILILYFNQAVYSV
jgi:hypothetical protein